MATLESVKSEMAMIIRGYGHRTAYVALAGSPFHTVYMYRQ